MSGAFVLSLGRSGSTMLSRMLQRHPELLSVSEYWTCLWMRSFGDPTISGADYWRLLAEPPAWYTNFIRKAAAAGEVPSEIIYEKEQRAGFAPERCPPILTMTLPALSERPEACFDELQRIVPRWPARPVSAHSAALFVLLAERQGAASWVERSGLSYWYVPDLVGGFPDARYLHLTRDGREVVLSMMGMRLFDPIVRVQWMLSVFRGGVVRRRLFFAHRAFARRALLAIASVERVLTRQHDRARPYSLPDRYAFEDRVKIYARCWASSCEMGLDAIAAIPAERVLTVRYEDVVADPRGTLAPMIDFLLPGHAHDAWLDEVATIPSPQPRRWETLEPSLAAAAEEIIRPMNHRLGYA